MSQRSKKRSRKESTSTVGTYDRTKFMTKEAEDRYTKFVMNKKALPERGIAEELIEDKGLNTVEERQWKRFTAQPPEGAILPLVREFYANVPSGSNGVVMVRGKEVSFSRTSINAFYELPDIEEDEYSLFLEDEEKDMKDVTELICGSRHIQWNKGANPENSFRINLLTEEAKIWMYFICARLIPSSHYSDVTRDRAFLIYSIMSGKSIDVGSVIFHNIIHSAGNKKGGLAFPYLIFRLCKLGGVQWAPKEEVVYPLAVIDRFMIGRLNKGKAQASSSAQPSATASAPPLRTYTRRPLSQQDMLQRMMNRQARMEKELIEAKEDRLRARKEIARLQHEANKWRDYADCAIGTLGTMLTTIATRVGVDMHAFPSLGVRPAPSESSSSTDDAPTDNEAQKEAGAGAGAGARAASQPQT